MAAQSINLAPRPPSVGQVSPIVAESETASQACLQSRLGRRTPLEVKPPRHGEAVDQRADPRMVQMSRPCASVRGFRVVRGSKSTSHVLAALSWPQRERASGAGNTLHSSRDHAIQALSRSFTLPSTSRAILMSSTICQSNMPTQTKSAPLAKANWNPSAG